MEQQRDIIASTAVFFSKLCQGKATVAYTKPQKMKKEESKRLRAEKIRSSILIFYMKDDKLSDSVKEEGGIMFHKLQ